jgi:4-hydroxybenzoate polyprenyltransferase
MRWLPYARLLRIPNVFTALADVALGAAVTVSLVPHVDAALVGRLALLALASACLYCGGMVWNDWFDFDEDRLERPFRPLPSGAIARAAAFRLGCALLAIGLLFATLAGWTVGGFRNQPAILGGALVAAILLYDGRLKRTPVGPVAMAACRFLNVLLGVSLLDADLLPWPTRLHLAGVVGLYIVGVTWFARTEATASSAQALTRAAFVVLLSLVVALALPLRLPPGSSSILFPYLLVAFGFYVGLPIVAAVLEPGPKKVQAAVKRMILGLIVLDATLAAVFVGAAGLLIVLLLPPALLLGKWVYST